MSETLLAFLQLTDGVSLNNNDNIFSVEDIIEAKETFDFYLDFIQIVYFSGAIYISINKNDQMLYANEIDANGDFYPLECDFEDFLERFIVNYGNT